MGGFKKIIIISLIAAAAFFLALVFLAVYVGFTSIKPVTREINDKLANYFLGIVRIPKEGIPSPSYDFYETSYFWEMETIQGEVTPVIFKYTPAFGKNDTNIEVVLEMPAGGDPSIFGKVLEAVIADEQSLRGAQDVEKANLSASSKAGYKQIGFAVKPNTKQVIKITWMYEKSALGEEVKSLYAKLGKYPDPVLKILYKLPHLTLSLLAGG